MKHNLTCYSTAMYSSWFWHAPSRTLFDCGEGVTLFMRNYIFGVERILISHSHADHVNGLLSFIGARNSARGDKEKPLDIYYPHNDKAIRFNWIPIIILRHSRFFTFVICLLVIKLLRGVLVLSLSLSVRISLSL